MITLTADNFDEVTKHDLLVIDFWAEWCSPCKAFAKVIENVSKQYPEVTFASVDVEAEKSLALEFSIRSVPFVMIMRSRVVVYADAGLLTEKALSELLDQAQSLDETVLREGEA